jgi:hypothetical protein
MLPLDYINKRISIVQWRAPESAEPRRLSPGKCMRIKLDALAHLVK